MIIKSALISSLQLKEVPRNIKLNTRYQIIVLSRNSINKNAISEFTGCSIEIVYRWGRRSDINDKPRSGRPAIYSEEIQLKIIAFYCQTTPLTGCGRWSLRWAEKHLKKHPNPVGQPISHSSIQRILKKHNLKPHLSKYFLQITDPDFFPKMEHLIPFYLNQPDHLYCFDECSGIQVLQRLAPDLQTEKMKKRLEEFEYIRNGTIDIFAFLHVKSGKVFAQCHANHKIETLVEVFEKHLKTLPENETIHYIMDNLASHSSYELCKLIAKYSNIECKSEKKLNTAENRREWLQSENKRIVFHYTPFHGSWLNMVEIWFGILKQKCLKESFNSPEAMYNAIYDFVNQWETLLAHPIKWKYDGSGLHQKAVNRFIRMLENAIEQMNTTFMTKQLLLMTNLIDQHWDKVEFEIWMILYEFLNLKLEQLNKIIFEDDSLKRKEKSKMALKILFDTLQIQINSIQKISA